MSEPPPIRFQDGAAYEHGMGVWSRLAGTVFLDWLDAPAGLRWVDVGCGNGAFTTLLIGRCAAAEVQAIDPSPGQLAFARTRPGTDRAVFQQGDAMALPFPDAAFDAAVMALVLFFVPDPSRGLAEMVRTTKPGGSVSAYVWDIHAAGLPIAPIHAGLRAIGIPAALPPSADISGIDALHDLWTAAGLQEIATREIAVERRFDDFDAYWRAGLMVGSLDERFATLTPDQTDRVKAETRRLLRVGPSGEVIATGKANAVKGRLPAA